VPSRLLYFPDENHWVLKQANSIRWYTEIGKWLDKWLAVEPDADVKEWRRHRESKMKESERLVVQK
jgi:hypothetical protein